MKIIEGTVEEIVEYQSRMGSDSAQVAQAAAESVPVGDEPPAARSATGANWDEEDDFFIRQFVYGRATSGAAANRIMQYLNDAATLGTVIEAGASERTKDGLTDYLMVRDDGPRRYGAIAYMKPRNAGLTLRLRPEHVEDLEDDHLQFRDVVAKQPYAVNCPLVDHEAVELAIELTRRALGLVRGDGDKSSETQRRSWLGQASRRATIALRELAAASRP